MIDSRILIGLIAVLISLSSVVYVGINEPTRQAEFKQAFQGRKVEQGAALFTEYCSPCHGIKGQGIEGVAPALNTAYFFENRLSDLGFQGSLESYITLTVAGGRPVMSAEGPYPQNMPTWSVDYGGPLRNDQIDSITAYILSWEEFAVGGEGAGPALTEVEGDTPEERGENLFQMMGCVGCHMINGQGGVVGPELTNVYEKGEDYVHQSIVNPNAVIAEGFQANLMPQTFGETLGEENINDIIAYLRAVHEQ